MMSFKKRLKKFVKNKQEQIQRGREVTLQMEAERLRKRNERIDNMKEGAIKAVMDGLRTKSSPMDVMKQEYTRRKYERKKKYHKS
jgi:hypothetical protein